jgi:hypothetical protein
VYLCDLLQNFVRAIRIIVVDKSPHVCDLFNDLIQRYTSQMPSISTHLSILQLDFLVYKNSSMSEIDIVINTISGPSDLFSLKFFLLAFQENNRPYFKNSKLFLSPTHLFSFLNGKEEMDHHKKLVLEYTQVVVMKYNGVPKQNTKSKNLNRLNKLYLPKGKVCFAYELHTSELETFYANNDLSSRFQALLRFTLDKKVLAAFMNLWNKHKSFFSDYDGSCLSSDVDKINRQAHQVVVNFNGCQIILHDFTVLDLKCGNIFSKEMLTTGRRCFVVQSGNMISLDPSTDSIIKQYVLENSLNALNCFCGIHLMCNNFQRVILEAIDASAADLRSNESIYDECWDDLSELFHKSVDIASLKARIPLHIFSCADRVNDWSSISWGYPLDKDDLESSTQAELTDEPPTVEPHKSKDLINVLNTAEVQDLGEIQSQDILEGLGFTTL